MKLSLISFLALVLLVLDQQYPPFAQFRDKASIVVYPIQYLVEMPFIISEKINGYFVSSRTLKLENEKLKLDNLKIRGKLLRFQALAEENVRLHALLNAASMNKENYLVANILHVDPDPFTHQIVLDKGLEDGVYLGQPIIDDRGVMGAVVSLNQVTARVMLLSDASHAIPVENLRNGVRAIASGTGTLGQLELDHIPNTIDIEKGDLFVTSGLGGRFPAGYPVGKVTYFSKDLSKAFATIHLTTEAFLDRGRQVLMVWSGEEHDKKK